MKRLLTLAEKAQGRFTQNSLQWFIQEQLEELTSMDELLQIGRRRTVVRRVFPRRRGGRCRRRAGLKNRRRIFARVPSRPGRGSPRYFADPGKGFIVRGSRNGSSVNFPPTRFVNATGWFGSPLRISPF